MTLYKIFRDSAENEEWKQKFKIIFILMQLSEMQVLLCFPWWSKGRWRRNRLKIGLILIAIGKTLTSGENSLLLKSTHLEINRKTRQVLFYFGWFWQPENVDTVQKSSTLQTLS